MGLPDFTFFKSFSKLERLNLTGNEHPEVKSLTPGGLALFAIHDSSFIPVEDEDQDFDWLSDLRYLYWKDFNTDPTVFLKIISSSKDSLVELEGLIQVADWFESTETYELPKLKSYRLKCYADESNSCGFLHFPNAQEVWANPNYENLKGYRKIETLRLEIGILADPNTDLAAGNQRKLVQCVENHSSWLKVLQIHGSGESNESNMYSIDPLLEFLKVGSSTDVKCPNLSKLMLSSRQVYDPELLAEVLLSRRLASCSRTTLYLGSDPIPGWRECRIEEFVAAEEGVLEDLSEEVRRKAGRAEVVEGIEEYLHKW